jgi:hypothetical protein
MLAEIETWNMKLKSKKIIAREIIVLAIVFAIGIITFSLTFLYNSFKINQEKIVTSEILSKTHLFDSLNISDQGINNTITIDDSAFKLLHEFDSTKGRGLSYQELKLLILNSKDRKSYFDEYNDQMEFKNFAEFEDLIQTDQSKIEFDKNKLRIDSIKELKVTTLQDEIAKLKQSKSNLTKGIITKEEQYDFSFWIMIISAILLILLRYVYYGISWSISILRIQETDNESNMHP